MRIVYIAGWLRSGTTLLSRLLGSLSDATAIGELSGVWEAAGRDDLCSCGARVLSCPAWGPAFRAVEEQHGLSLAGFPDFARLTRSVLRTRRMRELRRLRHTAPETWPQDVRTYVGVIGTLLSALSAATGSEILIDSSKLPPGLLTLTLLNDVRVDVVHIVRDPRAVATSERRSLRTSLAAPGSPPGRSLLRSSVYWSLGNLAVRWAGSAAASCSVVRYEELAADPDATLRRVHRRIGVDPCHRAASLDPGHLAVGNPSRHAKPATEVRPDLAWTKELSRVERALVMTVTLPARVVLRLGARPSGLRS